MEGKMQAHQKQRLLHGRVGKSLPGQPPCDAELTEVFDREGILVGWLGYAHLSGGLTRVFIPRRDEDMQADRYGDRERRILERGFGYTVPFKAS